MNKQDSVRSIDFVAVAVANLMNLIDRMWKKLPSRSPAAFWTITDAPDDSLEATWDRLRLDSKAV